MIYYTKITRTDIVELWRPAADCCNNISNTYTVTSSPCFCDFTRQLNLRGVEAFYITPLFPKPFGLVRPLELLWLRSELNLLREMFSRIINATKSFHGSQ